MRPPTAHGVVLDSGAVVRKVAVGPEWNPATLTYDAPVLPAGVVPVTQAQFFALGLGWTRSGGQWVPPAETAPARGAERFAMLEARLKARAVAVAALTARVDALTARVDTLAPLVDALTAQVTALAATVTGQAGQIAALDARVTTLETP